MPFVCFYQKGWARDYGAAFGVLFKLAAFFLVDESADVIVEAEEVEDEEVQEDEDEKDEKNKSFLEDKNAHYTGVLFLFFIISYIHLSFNQ